MNDGNVVGPLMERALQAEEPLPRSSVRWYARECDALRPEARDERIDIVNEHGVAAAAGGQQRAIVRELDEALGLGDVQVPPGDDLPNVQAGARRECKEFAVGGTRGAAATINLSDSCGQGRVQKRRQSVGTAAKSAAALDAARSSRFATGFTLPPCGRFAAFARWPLANPPDIELELLANGICGRLQPLTC